MNTGTYVKAYKPDPNWSYPKNFEMHPRVDKPKSRVGATRKLSGLIRKGKEQGIIVVADLISFEENTSGKFYIFDTNLNERLTPKFRTVSECMDLFENFLRSTNG